MEIQGITLNRRAATLAAGVAAAGALLLGGPVATAFAAPDNSVGGFVNNAGQFAGTLGTNAGQLVGVGGTNLNQFVGTGGTNLNQFVGTGGTNANQFVGTLGTNGLIFAGTLGNNLVGNPPNAGSRTTPSSGMQGSFQCNSTGGTCAR